MAESLFQLGHRAKSLLQTKPQFRLVYQQNAEYAPAGTMDWVAKVERLLRDMGAAEE